MGLVPLAFSVKPDRVLWVPSTKEKGRMMKVYVYDPPSKGESGLRPVHINLHGSGFVLKLHGMDDEVCRYISQTLDCTVLDADYAKGPERPFPAAYFEVLDIVAYVQAHSHLYDTTRITIGGSSSGGNLALSAASHLPKGTIKSVVTFYPPCFLKWKPDTRNTKETRAVGADIDGRIRQAFKMSYCPPDTNMTDDRLSPIYGDMKAFPAVTIVCGDKDPFYVDVEGFVSKLRSAGGDCVLMSVPGAGHDWERLAKPGTPYVKLRKEAFELVVRRLKEVY